MQKFKPSAKIYSQLKGQLLDQLRYQLKGQLLDQLRYQLKGQLRWELWDRLRDQQLPNQEKLDKAYLKLEQNIKDI